jgi:hypothetical protein
LTLSTKGDKEEKMAILLATVIYGTVVTPLKMRDF